MFNYFNTIELEAEALKLLTADEVDWVRYLQIEKQITKRVAQKTTLTTMGVIAGAVFIGKKMMDDNPLPIEDDQS